MTVERVFELINNLDVREPLRKYAPQWSIVVVNAAGEVLDVIKTKEWNFIVQRKYMEMYPRSVQFVATPGMYKTVDELQAAIDDCVWAHRNA